MPLPTVDDFIAANRNSEWGFFNLQGQEAAFHTYPRMIAFANQFPHLKDEGWEVTYMFPRRSVNYLLAWDKNHNETATVTIFRDGKPRQYNAGHSSVQRLRRLWQDTPMGNRGLTTVGRGSANYTFEW
jgi:hypothetical protein